jgi:hypothetical protein
MAQTKRKRRRKHRGTQGGRIDRRPARGRARSRAEAQNRARSRTKKSGPKVPDAPSWNSALKKGGIASVLFAGILALMGQHPKVIPVVAILMMGVYVPMAYTMDRFFYNRHLRKEAEKRQEREQRRAGHAEG